MTVERVLLASPRGYCAGVERAVDTVERRSSTPARRSTSASRSSTTSTSSGTSRPRRDLRRERAGGPEGATVVFSAHGVAPSVHENSRGPRARRDRRDLPARDEGARRGPALRRRRVHDLPDRPRRPRGGRGNDRRSARLDHARPGRRGGRGARAPPRTAARLRDADDALRRRDGRDHRGAPPPVPGDRGPKKEDICYATSNRQWAVKEMLAEIDLLLVIGSRNSSNSNRLVDVARAAGVPAYLIDDETEIDETLARRRRDRRHHVRRLRARAARRRASATGSARAASSGSSRTAWSTRTSLPAPGRLRRELALADANRRASSPRDDRRRSPASPRPTRERLLRDAVAVREQVVVERRLPVQRDPVGELEPGLLAERLTGWIRSRRVLRAPARRRGRVERDRHAVVCCDRPALAARSARRARRRARAFPATRKRPLPSSSNSPGSKRLADVAKLRAELGPEDRQVRLQRSSSASSGVEFDVVHAEFLPDLVHVARCEGAPRRVPLSGWRIFSPTSIGQPAELDDPPDLSHLVEQPRPAPAARASRRGNTESARLATRDEHLPEMVGEEREDRRDHPERLDERVPELP